MAMMTHHEQFSLEKTDKRVKLFPALLVVEL